MSIGTMMMLQTAEARRQRDSRGRYMDDDQTGPEMRADQGANQYTRERRGEMRMTRYATDEPDMRRADGNSRDNLDMRMADGYPAQARRQIRRRSMADEPSMGGEGYFVWDGPEPHQPAEGNTPDYWRRGDHERSNITDMREYGRRYSPQSRMDTGQHHRQMTQQRQIGFQNVKGEEETGHLPRHMAEEWVHGLKDGGKWRNPSDVKMLAQRAGVSGEDALTEFWAVINATYSDVCKVAKKYNVDRSDFYADLAKALFLEDEDAMPGKPMLYYEHLVKKDD